VLWRGEVLLDGTPVDFDEEPPRRGNTSTDLESDALVNGSEYQLLWSSRAVTWSEQGDPDRDGCGNRLETHGVSAVPIDARSRICLRTNRGRLVYLKVLGRDSDGYNAQATLWNST
jgi:hypothetical protein